MPSSKRVGILGSGDVGKQLGRGFAKHGFDVKLGSRDPAKLDAWRKETQGKASTGTFAQAATHGDIVILALNGAAVESAIDLAGTKNFSGKLVIDATNPLDFSHGMPPGLLFGTTDSMGERVQRKFPEAKVVKCFNTVPNEVMFRPKFEDANMLICGNDSDAKKEVTQILKEFGWAGSIDLGGIDNAKWLEALVPLWVRAALATGNYSSMFKFVQIAEPSTRH